MPVFEAGKGAWLFNKAENLKCFQDISTRTSQVFLLLDFSIDPSSALQGVACD